MPSYNYGNINPYLNQGMQVPNYSYQMYSGNNNYAYQQQPMLQNSYSQDSQGGKPVWVHSEQEARMYPVAKGDTIWMMDSDNMVAYFKSVDNSGMSSPLRIYDMVERQNTSVIPTQYSQVSMDNETAHQDMQNYVTWDALNALESKVNELVNAIQQKPAQTTGKRGSNNG